MYLTSRPFALLAGFVLTAPALGAQEVPVQLSLDEAIRIASENNPNWLATRNDIEVADWDVRAAWGALTPSASLGGSVGWRGAGEQNFGGITAADLGVTNQPNYYSSSYSANVNWGLSGATWYGPASARAGRAVTASQIEAERVALESGVTDRYLDVLRQQDAVALAEQQLARAEFNLRTAQAQAELGSATILDVRQAEVQVGRAEVALLQAESALETAGLTLLLQLGTSLDAFPELTTDFGLLEPAFTLEGLYELALEANPALATQLRTLESSRINEKIARSAYLPSLSMSAGISGFAREASSVDQLIAQAQAGVAGQIANCVRTNEIYRRLADPLPLLDCTQFAFTDAQRNSIIENNDAFPFGFMRSPPSATLSISVPVFQGLQRQQRLEAAEAQTRDAEYRLRGQQLALEANLRINLSRVRAAWESAQIEQRNVQLADEQLRLATERYQLGALPFFDLIDAETVKAQADRDLLNAIYLYHDAITQLEAVVGRPLRNR